MEDVALRGAREEDLAALGELLSQSWLVHWGPHVDETARRRYATERPHLGYLAAHWPEMVVATAGPAIVGVFHLRGDYLEAIHVAPAHIGRGIGRVLMARAEADGARRLEVRAFNTRAIQFYAARGWHETGRLDDTEMGAPVVTVAMTR